MSTACILVHPRRAALAAQIEGRHPQALGSQIADSLEIFLYELVAPLHDHNGAFGDRLMAAKDDVAQLVPVIGLEVTLGPVIRNRIVRRREEDRLHDGL